jgi:hypothetical protein
MCPSSTYTMRRNMKTKIENKHCRCQCFRCGGSVQVGQVVVSKYRGNGTKSSYYRIYHQACYEEMLY